MKMILKRDGRRTKFDEEKIIIAIKKAFEETENETYDEYAEAKAKNIASYVKDVVENSDKMLDVEAIQDLVEKGLMSCKKKNVAKQYILYREERRLARENTIDKDLDELFSGNNEYWNTENSNKDATNITVQRDYVAGITSTDITRRYLLPKEIVKAHDDGIIHFHDADYYIQRGITNCELTNLEDMLQNGTVINKTAIHRPHSLLTACTIATQIITAVSSSTYGGQTITISALSPFVRDSYNKYLKKYRDFGLSEEDCKKLADIDLKKEVKDAVQTFNYQINSMSTTNGQQPFLSLFMYIDEKPEYKKETAMLIEEFLKQRIQGMPNEQGVFITQAFPKLLYVLDEDNIHEDSEYYYLTKLACESTAKRMNPDYISAKVMKELKGDVYPCINKTCA
jgi:ribonucleoside-triphosphate reductase